jgi:hypothetical protein
VYDDGVFEGVTGSKSQSLEALLGQLVPSQKRTQQFIHPIVIPATYKLKDIVVFNENMERNTQVNHRCLSLQN